MINKTKLTTGTILASLGLFLAPAISAQENSSRFDEVIVTAQKKATGESVQDVPIAITAFDGELIENLQIRTINDISYSVPNVVLDSSGTVKGLQNFAIRGLGIVSSTPGPDPTVGTFVDGVYQGTNFGIILDTFDLESIEVLRGPQGVLFGRNVTGGAVLVNTRRPSHESSAKIKVGVESGLSYTVAGSVTGSIVEDVLSGKLVGYYNNDEGYFTNLANGNDNFGGDETYLFRGAFDLTAAPNVDFLLRLETGSTEGDGPINQNRGFASGHDVNLDNEGFTDISWTSASLENTWDVGIGDGVITNILSWRETDNINNSDIDAGPNNIFNFALNVDAVQYSAESRYSGSFFNDRWTTTLGGYFFTQDIQYREFRELFGGVLSGTFGGQQDQNTYGLFSSNDFAVTDAVTLTLGGRYTFEEKEVRVARQELRGPSPCTFDTSETCQFDFVDSEDWSNFSPKVGVQWDINDDSQIYGTWSRGFRSGGYNLRLTGAADPGPVDEEKQSAFEIGFKGDLFDDRLRTNIAVFSSDIDDVQRQVTTTQIIDGNATVVQAVTNSGNITIQGVEAEVTAVVTDSLFISGFLGLLDGDYNEVGDLNNDGVSDATDLALEFPLLAPVSWGVSLDYTHQLTSGELGLLASYNYRDEVESTEINVPTTRQPSINSFDASLRYTSEDERWTAAIYGKNLTDEVFLQTVNILSGITNGPGPDGDGSIQTPQKGRVIGAEVTYNF